MSRSADSVQGEWQSETCLKHNAHTPNTSSPLIRAMTFADRHAAPSPHVPSPVLSTLREQIPSLNTLRFRPYRGRDLEYEHRASSRDSIRRRPRRRPRFHFACAATSLEQAPRVTHLNPPITPSVSKSPKHLSPFKPIFAERCSWSFVHSKTKNLYLHPTWKVDELCNIQQKPKGRFPGQRKKQSTEFSKPNNYSCGQPSRETTHTIERFHQEPPRTRAQTRQGTTWT